LVCFPAFEIAHSVEEVASNSRVQNDIKRLVPWLAIGPVRVSSCSLIPVSSFQEFFLQIKEEMFFWLPESVQILFIVFVSIDVPTHPVLFPFKSKDVVVLREIEAKVDTTRARVSVVWPFGAVVQRTHHFIGDLSFVLHDVDFSTLRRKKKKKKSPE
jgi:hypothetical protein